MSPSEMWRSDEYDANGEVSIKEIVNLESAKNYCDAVQIIKGVFDDYAGNVVLKKLVENLFEYIAEYIELISQFNIINSTKEDLGELKRIDESRRIKHEALMDQIKIVNRFLSKNFNNNQGILPKNIYLSKRESITIWAKEIYIDLSELKRELN